MTASEARRRYQNRKRDRSQGVKARAKSNEQAHLRKVARREHVLNLLAQGKTKTEVIEITGLCRATINLYLRVG